MNFHTSPSSLKTETIVSKEYLKIYPNPASSILNFELEESYVHIQSINIYNAVGRKIHSQKNSHSLNIREFPKGLHIIYIELENGNIITKKIIFS